ncbi:MAG: YmdB family metallophosphoesterase [Paludibacteraceae bacterium]|nr:YmdB family metallophosphoesterase [Paludibacteraceae bacterium]
MKYNDASKIFLICLSSLLLMACAPKADTLTILHTNDTHSQVEPIAAGKRDGNHAGYARRLGVIQQERAADPNLILVDAGDFCQGTPYFNFYHGRVEIDAMNRMGYDAITLGNHEFDNGVDTLATILKNAQFAVVSANYNVLGTPLEGIVKPYTVLTRAGVRVGILGVGVNPEGLIATKNFAPVQYIEPFAAAQKAATELKTKHHCDLIICLSHLGTDTDEKLAQQTQYIDVIVGGHTHKIITNHYVENLDGDTVLLAQMGKSGARMGKILLKMQK